MSKLPLLALTPFLLAGCNGALLGQVVVLGITVGIFFSTLRLGQAEAARSQADQSTSTAGRG